MSDAPRSSTPVRRPKRPRRLNTTEEIREELFRERDSDSDAAISGSSRSLGSDLHLSDDENIIDLSDIEIEEIAHDSDSGSVAGVDSDHSDDDDDVAGPSTSSGTRARGRGRGRGRRAPRGGTAGVMGFFYVFCLYFSVYSKIQDL